ncbi:allantoinase [Heterostelium album PN500]|uniref:allantoinase n=1 Tax=Heterostelium pallidum (strain ATCC 26659 / Pp 5 / PN500) TaxID=670386 RepID=D3BLP5_HETP5|nr:allantoinase [Heterostelium album PN500]EFA77496.1 allantoinase [Heterostelium album PN500]|eukprot:XP_020429624.1 allantoinase [Heterostelium album PN500]
MVKSIVRGKRVIFNGSVKEATIVVDDGVVVDILPYEHGLPAGSYKTLVDAPDNQVVMGGLVDSHVHVNEPGRTEWEGFVTATSAAAAGGVTTIVDMPLNSDPVTTSFAALQSKISSMSGKCFVDVGLLGGIIPNNEDQIKRMILEGGVVGFKCFLVHSGIDDFPAVEREHVDRAMKVMAELKHVGKDVVVMFHAEVPGPIDDAIAKLEDDCDTGDYHTFLSSRPKASENEAIDMVISLTRENNVRTHIVHLSSAEALPMIRAAHTDNIPISAETTFHYLYFEAEKVPHGNTLYKCCPPIRESLNRDALWQAVSDRTVSMIISDHSPCTVNLKLLEDGDFMKAWGGISSLQLGLSIIWTEAKRRGILSLTDLPELMSDAPAKLVNLNDRKGSIAVGRDADFLVWDPEASFTVDQEKMYVRNRASPYHGQTLYGVVEQTILRGREIYSKRNGHIEIFTGERLTPTNIQSSSSGYADIRLPPIARLNSQLSDTDFLSVVNMLLEVAPPLASGLLAARPYSSYDQLIETVVAIIEQCTTEQKVEIINSHPKIGANPSKISTLSYYEQGYHRESHPDKDPEQQRILEALNSLNNEYQQKYGFSFIVFVNGRTKAEIIPIIQQRLHHSTKEQELATGLSEYIEIAKSRLNKLL